jgi:2'-5' RNA ligase
MRLFVALDLPGHLRLALAGLSGGIPGARWTPPENYHLTLRFIGEVPNWQAQELDDALAAVRGREVVLTLAGVGSFSDRGRATSVWAGVERNDRLTHLQQKIETALQRAGLEPERRRFTPHITLARVDGAEEAKVARWIAANNLFRAAPTPIDAFSLFSSRLGKEQAVYTPEVDYALA